MREQFNYPNDPMERRYGPHRGVLFRYDKAEHIKIEVSATSTFIDFSTDKTAEEAADAYEDIFGERFRIQEALSPDGVLDDTVEDGVVRIGPKGFLLVALKSYMYGWTEPHQPFEDREDSTPTVTINELSRPYDRRNTDLVNKLASPLVLADLSDTLPYINSMRV